MLYHSGSNLMLFCVLCWFRSVSTLTDDYFKESDLSALNKERFNSLIRKELKRWCPPLSVGQFPLARESVMMGLQIWFFNFNIETAYIASGHVSLTFDHTQTQFVSLAALSLNLTVCPCCLIHPDCLPLLSNPLWTLQISASRCTGSFQKILPWTDYIVAGLLKLMGKQTKT